MLVSFAAGCGNQAQTTGRITGIRVVNASCFSSVGCGVWRVDPAMIEVSGEGVCSFRLVLGNGSFPVPVDRWDFSKGPRTFELLYHGWPGPKTLIADGGSDCAGRASLVHHVFTNQGSSGEDWRIGMNAPNQYCYAVPAPGGGSFPPLRPGTRVHITAGTTPEVAFGGGVHYDPDGKPGSIAPASFFFPGYKEYSLIVTVGPEVHQGGTNTTFNVTQGGDVGLCDNDDDPSDNGGGWQVTIFVDESQAP